MTPKTGISNISDIDKAFDIFSPEQEYMLGRETAANILARYQLYDDKEMTEYLNLICGAITANSPKPYIFSGYHVAIVGDESDINLFATPSGHIFITRGMLINAKSEDELACVLAYGVATIQLEQGIRVIKTYRIDLAITSIGATSPGDVALMGSSSVERILSLISMQILEADTAALSLLTTAGYDVNAYPELLKRMNNDNARGFYSTSFERRILNAEEWINRNNIKTNDTSLYRVERFNKIFMR